MRSWKPVCSARFLIDQLDVLGLRVESRADRRRADVLLEQPVRRLGDAIARSTCRQRIGRELLAQADRHRILHMRAARLQDVVERLRTVFEGFGQLVEDRQEVAHLGQRRDAHRGRKDVVRRLRHVHVVIGVDDRVIATLPAANTLGAKDLDGAIGEHLVRVHVVRHAGAGLERIDTEVVDQRCAQGRA